MGSYNGSAFSLEAGPPTYSEVMGLASLEKAGAGSADRAGGKSTRTVDLSLAPAPGAGRYAPNTKLAAITLKTAKALMLTSGTRPSRLWSAGSEPC